MRLTYLDLILLSVIFSVSASVQYFDNSKLCRPHQITVTTTTYATELVDSEAYTKARDGPVNGIATHPEYDDHLPYQFTKASGWEQDAHEGNYPTAKIAKPASQVADPISHHGNSGVTLKWPKPSPKTADPVFDHGPKGHGSQLEHASGRSTRPTGQGELVSVYFIFYSLLTFDAGPRSNDESDPKHLTAGSKLSSTDPATVAHPHATSGSHQRPASGSHDLHASPTWGGKFSVFHGYNSSTSLNLNVHAASMFPWIFVFTGSHFQCL
jgi:hypothetical protein